MNKIMKDYYKILGVSEDATCEKINEVFLKARLMDDNFDNKLEAWTVLTNPKSRNIHNRKRTEQQKHQKFDVQKSQTQVQQCRLCGRPLPEWWKDVFYWGRDTHRSQCSICGNCLTNEGDFWGKCSVCREKILKKRWEEKEKIKKQKHAVLEEQKRLRDLKTEQERQQKELERQQEHEAEMVQYKKLRKEIESMPQYQIWREEVLKRLGRRCAVCGSTEDLEVDHRYVSFYKIVKRYEITNTVQAYECAALWDVNNGAPLCKLHHNRTKSSVHYRENNPQ